MIIHISRERLERVMAQGYSFSVRSRDEFTQPVGWAGNGPLTEYHVLNGEQAVCGKCGSLFDSVAADTPSELETLKEQARRVA